MSRSSDYQWRIAEWWNAAGDHHLGAPSELLYDEEEHPHGPKELTIEVRYGTGETQYFNTTSWDGWLMRELEVEVVDAADYYLEAIRG